MFCRKERTFVVDIKTAFLQRFVKMLIIELSKLSWIINLVRYTHIHTQLRHHELIQDSYRVTTSSVTLILREPSVWNTVTLFRPVENYHLVTILGVRHYQ